MLVADLAEDLGVPFAQLAPDTVARLEKRLAPGLVATNPLDVWSTGADTESPFRDCLDDAGRRSFGRRRGVGGRPRARVRRRHGVQRCGRVGRRADRQARLVLTNPGVGSGPGGSDAAARPWRAGPRGDPVGACGRSATCSPTRLRRRPSAGPVDAARRARWVDRLDGNTFRTGWGSLPTTGSRSCPIDGRRPCAEAVAAADELGYPAVVKTAADGISHKVDVDGVRLDLPDADGVRAAYEDLAQRLGPDVVVQPCVAPGVELALGLVRDPLLGPLVVVASGGSLVELLNQRSVALPPVDRTTAGALIDRAPVEQSSCAGTEVARRVTWTRRSTRCWRCRSWPASSVTTSRHST